MDPTGGANGAVDILDLGRVRRVTITGESWGYDGYSADRTVFETSYSRQLLRDLTRVKGPAWLRDEIDRTERPEYLEARLRRFVTRFCSDPAGLTVLDIGCGAAASSILLARMGFDVVGLDVAQDLVDVGRLRVREAGVAPRVELRHVPPGSAALPFGDETFPVVMFHAVLEHVPPEHRRVLLQEAWRVLRKRGLLCIHDTPNRLWPRDGHTTGLWFVTWLPFGIAARYARRFSDRVGSDTSDDALVSMGLRAPSYCEIRRALPPDAECLNPSVGDDIRFAFGPTDRRRRSLPRAAARRVVISLLRAAGHIAGTALGVPAAALLQNVDVCFRKP